MKKLLLSLCAVCAIVALCIFISCEKADISNEVDEPSGNLKVSVFQIEQTAFSTFTRAEQPASEVCTRLNFAIYDMDGTRLKLTSQTSSNADFGTTSFKLEQGDYLLVVLGHSANGNPTMTNPEKIQFTNSTGYTDTFLSCDTVTIGEEPIDMQVTLNRIVALCRFVITDDFPDEVKKMRFYYTGGSGAFDAHTGLGSVNSKQEVKFDVDPTQKQFDLYTFLHDTEGTIALKVTALDAAGNELYTREPFEVPMQQNHITWLTGAFFDGSGSSSTNVTTVTVITDWAGENHISF